MALAMAFGGAMAQDPDKSGASGTSSGTAASSSPASSTRAGTAGKVASGDRTMMRDIAHANLSEIAAARLALEKSQSDDVKSFAQRMIDDHTKAQQALQALADSKGVKLPTEPDAKHKAMAKRLSGMKGDAFDKRYLKQGGLNDHENAHKLLVRVQEKAKDPDLQAYAAKVITPVDQHLALAREVAPKHGAGDSKGSMKGAAAGSGAMGSQTAGGSMSGSSGAGATASGGTMR